MIHIVHRPMTQFADTTTPGIHLVQPDRTTIRQARKMAKRMKLRCVFVYK